MESILRGLTVYLFLLILFRLAGKRTLSQATSFDLVLLLIISETTQEAMVAGDHSVTNSFLLIMTLTGSSMVLTLLKYRFPTLERWLDGCPIIIVEKGKPLQDRMRQHRVTEEEILASARMMHGLERMDQIKYAVLEAEGEISIIPMETKK